MKGSTRTKKAVAVGALVLAGFGAGAAVAITGSASAATDAVKNGASTVRQNFDPSKSIRSDEHLLSGSTATKVRDAALAKYPNATIERVETDSDGVYEAHIVTTAGDHVIVAVGKDFAVTGTQTGGGPGGPGGHGGPGDDDGDGPGAPAPSQSGTAS